MQPVLLIPLVACVLATMIAAAILSHDAGQRTTRLTAGVLACSAWWSLCEVLWNVQDDPEVVLWLVKASGIGWLWLGPLALDFVTEILGPARSRLRRAVPAAYAASALSVALYVGTPWCLSEAVRTDWGWSYRFGPLFPFVYAVTIGCILVVLAQWHRLFSQGVKRERRQARLMFVAIALPMSLASLTDVLLPMLDVHVPRVGSASILALGAIVAWSVLRHGYFLLAPNAFASEILASLRDGVALLHRDRSIRTGNGGLARLAGCSIPDLTNMRVARLLPELAGAGSEKLDAFETEFHPFDGEPFPVSVSSSPLHGEDGGRLGEVFAIQDLREVSALRARLLTSGRLAAVGELAAGIAHEIASPISFARSSLTQLQQHWQAVAETTRSSERADELEQVLSEGEELIEESVEGVDRVAGIVRAVGAFSHAGRGRAEPVDVNQLLDHAVDVAVLSFSVVVERCYAELPLVECDPQQLKQVFLNLLLNSLQAVGDYGNIRLVTEARGEWVTIRVEDDGPGIPDEHLDRIFDPFFTTRPAESVGLGLAHCHEIVRAHGGGIFATSRPGRGACFEVRLPASGQAAGTRVR